MKRFNEILVLAPHANDGEFGCGGVMSRFLEEGSSIHYAVFSKAVKSLPPDFPADMLERELRAATSALGLTRDNCNQVHVFDFEVRTFPTHRQDILELLIKTAQ